MLYQFLFHALLRRVDAERAHRVSLAGLRALTAVPGTSRLMGRLLGPREPELRVRALGLDFPGPLGLAAGFDKNARGVTGLTALGFGHVEIGTVTAQPQPGNPRPRLFRLVDDRAVVNRMGFNNEGSEAVARRLRAQRAGRARNPVIGVNIGKTKVVPESEAVADYVTSARRFADVADYLVVNVSSPNTPGLRDLQAAQRLRPLLGAVRRALDEAGRPDLPLLVKIAPDLADEDVDAVADLAVELGLHGIIATNTTISREGLATDPDEVAAAGAGGLSGAPLKARSLEVLRRLRARVGDRLVLVAVGGIETPEDAWARIRAGASLVQGYTGLVYGGPLWPRRVHRGLVALARSEGYASVADAVGADVDPAPSRSSA
ncbi:quinone-dependent dihydroorotate dehydrogenase [Thermobifida halotolerans]|uniref:Dihydroorotate dehydrogenase (quinone) n=1 Tax=Thermobifida halotolerans TaxID=483545 RepID=A0A399G496_9ACTN|nr:quinone-dependent dihydroorotate dehydrogenase [Thermobifida halotolerans]UOE20058.1 quinone-dependent dihydroorotate dehydrogenase [Thermobifida halotolerans]